MKKKSISANLAGACLLFVSVAYCMPMRAADDDNQTIDQKVANLKGYVLGGKMNTVRSVTGILVISWMRPTIIF